MSGCAICSDLSERRTRVNCPPHGAKNWSDAHHGSALPVVTRIRYFLIKLYFYKSCCVITLSGPKNPTLCPMI